MGKISGSKCTAAECAGYMGVVKLACLLRLAYIRVWPEGV